MYELYWWFAEPDSPEDVELESIRIQLEGETSDRFFDIAIEKLKSENFIEQVETLPSTFSITHRCISHVEKNLDDPDSFLWQVHLNREPSSRPRIPASGRYVSLDHNSQEYKDALSSGEKLIAEIENSNSFLETESDERTTRLNELKAGYRLLRAPLVSQTKVKVVLGSALIYLIAKFADEPVGELANVAWAALKRLIGLD